MYAWPRHHPLCGYLDNGPWLFFALFCFVVVDVLLLITDFPVIHSLKYKYFVSLWSTRVFASAGYLIEVEKVAGGWAESKQAASDSQSLPSV